jgi:predicted nucleic acid-binding protein
LEIKEGLLFDTNIFLEIFLSQENSELSKTLINHDKLNKIFLSDFSLHSIGVILSRKNKSQIFDLFINDIIQSKKIEILSINIENMPKITQNIANFNLDFDDAYQLSLCNIYNLSIVTYDKDFNKDKINYLSPFELIEIINNE